MTHLILIQNDFSHTKVKSILRGSPQGSFFVDTKIFGYLNSHPLLNTYNFLKISLRSFLFSFYFGIKYRKLILPSASFIFFPTVILYFFSCIQFLSFRFSFKFLRECYWSFIATLQRFSVPISPPFTSARSFSKYDSRFVICASFFYKLYFSIAFILLGNPKTYYTPYCGYVHHFIPSYVSVNLGSFVSITNPIDYKIRFASTKSQLRHRHILDTHTLLPDTSQYSQITKNLEERFRGRKDSIIYYTPRAPYTPSTDDTLIKDKFTINSLRVDNGFACIYMHEFTDFHQDSTSLSSTFFSYTHWLYAVCHFLKSRSIPFVIKLHPTVISNVPGYELSRAILNKFFAPYFASQFVTINTSELIDLGLRLGITACGTISTELAYLGVHAASVETAPYANFEFSHTYCNLEQLALAWYNSTKPLSTTQTSKLQHNVVKYLSCSQTFKSTLFNSSLVNKNTLALSSSLHSFYQQP